MTPLLNIVLHQPEIAENTGNVGRTCVALGAKLWLVRPLGFRLDDRRLRRAGLDYWQYLDWEAVDDWPARWPGWPRKRGQVQFAGTARRVLRTNWTCPLFRGGCGSSRSTRPVAYTDAAFAPGDGLVFGSESQGLPASLLELHADRCLRIPMRAEARSLNLAVSVAVAAFEALRQSLR